MLFKKTNSKIDKLKQIYNEYEAGKIKKENLPSKVEDETKIKWTSEASKLLNRVSTKDVTFNNFLNSLKFLNKSGNLLPKYNKKDFPVINQNRITAMKNMKLPETTEEVKFVTDKVKSFMNNDIDIRTFYKEMEDNNINLDNDHISRLLTLLDYGNDVKYSDLISSILKYKDVPNKRKILEENVDKIKPLNAHNPTLFEESEFRNRKSSIRQFKNCDTYLSQRYLFDWEIGQLKDAIEFEENKDKILSTKPKSQIFNGEILNIEQKKITRKSKNDNSVGNFIDWGNPKLYKKVATTSIYLNTEPTKKGITTKYKNISNLNLSYISKKSEVKECTKELNKSLSTRNLKLHTTSKENFLSCL